MSKLQSTKLAAKESVKENFEKMPRSLFDYLELGLITQNEMVMFLFLLGRHNVEYGYAFPSIKQIELGTNLSRETVNKGIKKLVSVGLLGKFSTGTHSNNIYVPYLPIEKNELYNLVPDEVEKFENKKGKLKTFETIDKQRLQDMIDNS